MVNHPGFQNCISTRNSGKLQYTFIFVVNYLQFNPVFISSEYRQFVFFNFQIYENMNKQFMFQNKYKFLVRLLQIICKYCSIIQCFASTRLQVQYCGAVRKQGEFSKWYRIRELWPATKDLLFSNPEVKYKSTAVVTRGAVAALSAVLPVVRRKHEIHFGKFSRAAVFVVRCAAQSRIVGSGLRL